MGNHTYLPGPFLILANSSKIYLHFEIPHEIEETEWQARKCGRRIHGVYWVLGTLRMPRIVGDKAGKVGRPRQTGSWVAFWVETAV